MRTPLIAGNWKMNLSRERAIALAVAIRDRLPDPQRVDVLVCPPLVYLDSVGQAISGSGIALGAQDMYHEPGGAFTGEVSGPMLCDLGCRYVILGHSERRHILGESDEDVCRKARAALDVGLSPIVCVGETLAQRESGATQEVIARQFDRSLRNLSADEIGRCVIAYEPVWAIGTGKVATPSEAVEVHVALRNLLEQRYNSTVAANVRIQYGGSVKAANARDLLSRPEIDGALVGGASLKADPFLAIVAAAQSSS